MTDPRDTLKKSGFWLEKDAKNGQIWTDGYSKLLCPNTFVDGPAIHNFEQQVHAAKEKRHQLQIVRNAGNGGFQQPLFSVAKIEKPELEKAFGNVKQETVDEKPQKHDPRLGEGRGIARPVTDLETPLFKLIAQYKLEEMRVPKMIPLLKKAGFDLTYQQIVTTVATINRIRERNGMPKLVEKRIKRRGPYKVETKSQNREPTLAVPDAVMSILESRALTDEKKVALLELWADDAANTLPDAVVNILTEPAFSTELKLKMILALK